jgi:hypothetical protein
LIPCCLQQGALFSLQELDSFVKFWPDKTVNHENSKKENTNRECHALIRSGYLPIMLLFWDEDRSDGFDAEVKLLFDETITEHLDIESIIFLSERLRQLLCGEKQ